MPSNSLMGGWSDTDVNDVLGREAVWSVFIGAHAYHFNLGQCPV